MIRKPSCIFKRFSTKGTIAREDLLRGGTSELPNATRDRAWRKTAQSNRKSATGSAIGRLQTLGIHQFGFVFWSWRGRRWQQLLEFLVFERAATCWQPHAILGGLRLGLLWERILASASRCTCHYRHEQRGRRNYHQPGLELLSWTWFHCLSGRSFCKSRIQVER